MHDDYSLSYVRRGTFGYRSRGASFELVAGSVLVGYPGEEYVCTHDHARGEGDECLSFHLRKELVEEVGHRPAAWRRRCVPPLSELMVLADLRRQGLTLGRLRQLLETLRDRFNVRLFDAIGGSGALSLLTDGRDVYARTAKGQFYNLLRDPEQPLLVIAPEAGWRELSSKPGGSARKRSRAGGLKKARRKKKDAG